MTKENAKRLYEHFKAKNMRAEARDILAKYPEFEKSEPAKSKKSE